MATPVMHPLVVALALVLSLVSLRSTTATDASAPNELDANPAITVSIAIPTDTLRVLRTDEYVALPPVRVKNNTTSSQQVYFSCSHGATIISCSSHPSAALIPAGDSTTASLSFTYPDVQFTSPIYIIVSGGGVVDTTQVVMKALASSISVTPQNSSRSNSPGTHYAQFIVSNGTLEADLVSLSCTRQGKVQSCAVQGPNPIEARGIIDNGGSYTYTQDTVVVAYTTAASSGTGWVRLTAAGVTTSGGQYNITAVPTPPSYTITSLGNGQGLQSSMVEGHFRVRNTGSTSQVLSLTCAGIHATCFPGQSSVTVAGNDSADVSVSFHTSMGGWGVETLGNAIVTGTGGSTQGAFQALVGRPVFTVDPTIPPRMPTGPAVIPTSVHNIGNLPDSVSITCAFDSGCSVSPAVAYLAAGASIEAEITVQPDTAGTYYFFASATGGSGTTPGQDTASITVGGVEVQLLHNPNTSLVSNSAVTASVAVGAYGDGLEQYTFSCLPSGKITACDFETDERLVDGQSVTQAPLQLNLVTAGAGTGVARLVAQSGTSTDTANVSFIISGDSIVVSPVQGAMSGGSNASFIVENRGSTRREVAFRCEFSGGGACSPSQSGAWIAGGVSLDVAVPLGGRTSGTASLFADSDSAGSSAWGQYTLSAAPSWPLLSLQPAGPQRVVAAGKPAVAVFAVRQSVQGTAYFHCAATGVVSCSTPVEVVLTGDTLWQTIEVPITTSGIGQGSVTLSFGTATPAVQQIMSVAPNLRIFPVNAATLSPPAYTAGLSTNFRVVNDGPGSDRISLACGVFLLAACRLDYDEIDLPGNDSTVVTVIYDTEMPTQGAIATLTLTGTGGSQSAEGKTLVHPQGSLLIITAADSQQLVLRPNVTDTVSFHLREAGNITRAYEFACSIDGAVAGCSIVGSPHRWSHLLASDSIMPVAVTAGATAGTGTLSLTAVDDTAHAVVDVLVDASMVIIAAGEPVATMPLTGVTPAEFIVTNGGTLPDSVTFVCPTTGGISCVGAPPTIGLLAPQETRVVTTGVAYTGGAANGTVRLRGTGRDNEDEDVQVVVARDVGPGPIHVRTEDQTSLNRGGCLTTAAGQYGAYQCGNLLYAYSLPAFRTMNTDRTLTLLYNSATAYPAPIVTAEIWIDYSTIQPDSVLFNVKVGAVTYPFSFTGAGIGVERNGSYHPRRVSLPLPVELPTGVHSYEVEAIPYYGAVTDSAWIGSTTGRLITIDRRTSPYGAGWSLAGTERLLPDTATGGQLLVSGDGSAWLYGRPDVNVARWVAPVGAYRDTIQYGYFGVDADSAWGYRRVTRDRTTYLYDLNGRLEWVLSMEGRRARYFYGGPSADARIDSIRIAPHQSGLRYRLLYSGGQLTSVRDPANRATTVTQVGGRVTALRAPGMPTDTAQTFYYDGNSRMEWSKSERGDRSDYVYAPGTAVLEEAHVPHMPVSTFNGLVIEHAVATTVRTAFAPAELAGMARASNGNRSVLADSVHTLIDGPRGDVNDHTRIWTNASGAPTRITDPVGLTTTIAYDTTFPALPRLVLHPDGRSTAFGWSSPRALLTEQRDSFPGATQAAVTRYRYPASGDLAHLPTAVITPTGDSTAYTYWPNNGLVRRIRAVNGHTTHFVHYTSGARNGLLRSVLDSVAVFDSVGANAVRPLSWKFAYDARGNLTSDTTPSGRTNRYALDSFGRVIAHTDPTGYVRAFTYDAVNRITSTAGIRGTDTLRTTYEYYARFLRKVTDPRGVTREYHPTVLDRLLWEKDDYGKATRYSYNEAGAIILRRDRLFEPAGNLVNNHVRFTYDAAGRITQMKWPTTVLDSIPDHLTYAYNPSTGQLAQRSTRDWRISYEYSGAGLVTRELSEQLVPSGARSDNRYAYDIAGRRTSMTQQRPSQAVTDSIWYTYDLQDKTLRTIGVRWNSNVADSTNFTWDELGRRKQVIIGARSSGLAMVRIDYRYDEDGAMREFCAVGESSTHPDEAFNVRERLRVDSAGRIRTTNANHNSCAPSQLSGMDRRYAYDVHGRLKSIAGMGDSLHYAYDRSGNMVSEYRKNGTLPRQTSYTISAGHNRLTSYSITGQALIKSQGIVYNHNGDRISEYSVMTDPLAFLDDRAYWHDGLGRTIGSRQWTVEGRWAHSGADQVDYEAAVETWDTGCRYDPAGRLALDCSGVGWLSYDGDNAVSWGTTESNRAVYVHGPGTDDPLMGFAQQNGAPTYFYYVTDGQGRQHAVGTSTGANYADSVYASPAGGISNARSYDASRSSSSVRSGLSFFRNRHFDMETNRWTQEDPIGLAGGMNLYAYAGNNPATFTDPFGLCPEDKGGDGKTAFLSDCPPGSEGWREFGQQVTNTLRPIVQDVTAPSPPPSQCIAEGRKDLRDTVIGVENYAVGLLASAIGTWISGKVMEVAPLPRAIRMGGPHGIVMNPTYIARTGLRASATAMTVGSGAMLVAEKFGIPLMCGMNSGYYDREEP